MKFRFEDLPIIPQIIRELQSWKVLGPCFICSFILVFCSEFFYDILNCMYTILIRPISALLLIICFGCVLSNCMKWGKEVANREIEQYKVKKLLWRLPEEEIAMLRYILSRPVEVTWLPHNNTAMLSLYHKKILECIPPISGMSDLRGNLLGNSAQCLPYSINSHIRDYIKAHQSELDTKWGISRNICKELDEYQRSSYASVTQY